MRRLITIFAVSAVSLAALFLIAGRRLSDLSGYVRATAATGIDEVEDNLPKEIHDRKLANEIEAARQDLIDRQVQLNLSRRQLDQLQSDVERLTGSVARRKRLLAEAYPVLQQAIDQEQHLVVFASQQQSLDAFQADLDELMAQQERESRQLEIKQEGLQRLQTSVREGETALAEMRRALETAEQEVAVLKSRRGQAEMESATLDMIASVTSEGDAAATTINGSLTRLRTEVDQMEARNEARRDLAPVADRPMDNQVARSWSRLETLRAIHDEFGNEGDGPSVADSGDDAAQPVATGGPEVDDDETAATAPTKNIAADKVVIEIQSRQRGEDSSESDE